VEPDYLPHSEVLFQPHLDPISRWGVVGGGGGGGCLGAVPLKRFFWENFLVKYCNFIVNLNNSSLGCRSNGRSYVRVFFPIRKLSFMYEEIVLQ
jgi:hypothetical protein